MSVRPSVRMSVCLSVCLYVCLSVYPSGLGGNAISRPLIKTDVWFPRASLLMDVVFLVFFYIYLPWVFEILISRWWRVKKPLGAEPSSAPPGSWPKHEIKWRKNYMDLRILSLRPLVLSGLLSSRPFIFFWPFVCYYLFYSCYLSVICL